MKRLMIYFFYDKDGIVDNYVPYFLTSFRPYCEQICVVVNGCLTNESKTKLGKSCDTLLIRENFGFDSAAYKHAIEHYGYEKLKEYDEVIFANMTMFGPIFPANEIFNRMDKEDVDFWGITMHPAQNIHFAGVKVEKHIQSYFIVYRNSILKTPHFKDYWDTHKTPETYLEAIAFHEIREQLYFENLGFKYSSYIPYTEIPKGKPYFYYICKDIKENRMPFVKRKIFQPKEQMLYYPIEGTLLGLLDIIKENTDYDLNLIVENIERTMLNKITYPGLIKQYALMTLKMCFLPWHWKRYKAQRSTIPQIWKLLKENR